MVTEDDTKPILQTGMNVGCKQQMQHQCACQCLSVCLSQETVDQL